MRETNPADLTADRIAVNRPSPDTPICFNVGGFNVWARTSAHARTILDQLTRTEKPICRTVLCFEGEEFELGPPTPVPEREKSTSTLPTVEDIDHWHDTGSIGDLYIWCQKMRQMLESGTPDESAAQRGEQS